MKLSAVASSLLSIVAVSATNLVDLSARGDQVIFRGNITAPRAEILLPPRRVFDFRYSPSNWCGNAYSGVSAWITRSPNLSVNSTGGIQFTIPDSFGVLWKYGDWLQPYNPVLNPPTADAPPTTLSMPDFTHLGIVPGTVYLSVIETAENCNNTFGGPTQYGLATIRLINT